MEVKVYFDENGALVVKPEGVSNPLAILGLLELAKSVVIEQTSNKTKDKESPKETNE